MKVRIHLLSQSQPVERPDVVNAYVKADFYCIQLSDDSVEKYPAVNIFRVTEEP